MEKFGFTPEAKKLHKPFPSYVIHHYSQVWELEGKIRLNVQTKESIFSLTITRQGIQC